MVSDPGLVLVAELSVAELSVLELVCDSEVEELDDSELEIALEGPEPEDVSDAPVLVK